MRRLINAMRTGIFRGVQHGCERADAYKSAEKEKRAALFAAKLILARGVEADSFDGFLIINSVAPIFDVKPESFSESVPLIMKNIKQEKLDRKNRKAMKRQSGGVKQLPLLFWTAVRIRTGRGETLRVIRKDVIQARRAKNVRLNGRIDGDVFNEWFEPLKAYKEREQAMAALEADVKDWLSHEARIKFGIFKQNAEGL